MDFQRPLVVDNFKVGRLNGLAVTDVHLYVVYDFYVFYRYIYQAPMPPRLLAVPEKETVIFKGETSLLCIRAVGTHPLM